MTRNKMKADSQAKYDVGQIVHHQLFGYRGVIFEIDPQFMLTDEWYEQVAKSRPPRDKPWYHVLVDDAQHTTYVAEQNLESTDDLQAINHPMVEHIFVAFTDGKYQLGSHQIQ